MGISPRFKDEVDEVAGAGRRDLPGTHSCRSNRRKEEEELCEDAHALKRTPHHEMAPKVPTTPVKPPHTGKQIKKAIQSKVHHHDQDD